MKVPFKNPLKLIPYWPLIVLPLFFIYFGSFLNVFVSAINHNQMPVFVPGGICEPADFAKDVEHSCMDAHTHLKFLADWIFVKDGIASIGDVFIFLGEPLRFPFLYMWIALVIKERNTRKKT